MTLSSQEKHLFLLLSYFRAYPTTLLLKILEGRMHGPSPYLKLFWGPSPQSTPRAPPMLHILTYRESELSAAIAVQLLQTDIDTKPDEIANNNVTPVKVQ